MYTGRLIFSQIMDHLPMHEFRRCVHRYQGNHRVKSFRCHDQYLSMAFAQLTFRESLRSTESCLQAQHAKLYHMGIRGGISRSTLADANEQRDWRIYALDATTIDLCLSAFPWAHFRSTKAAVKLHTLLDLRGNIPTFIHISDGKLHDVHALDFMTLEAGAFYRLFNAFIR